ncbi:toxin-antitoxin system YwqK family antitoxin [Mucilaginibacter psychrotolerans]|uniref:TonB C-terminal domain-containing protein n=1 Tax=Mucilaginibacter psychrotolerans TaxID=1524096 RepID=A0A4Y8S5F4_9SPHI|nr:hypothetical protein [Mucilaginibacter psychrotolerans]TFF34122.1 hypothetical protein E2R66_23115 [Mucilaginibacter psychrotolerans]
MLKTLILFFSCILLAYSGNAQETTKKKNWLTNSVQEVTTVLKTNKNVKQGLYMALFQKTTVVATGMYDNNKKVGLWRFFSSQGQQLEVYDYTAEKLFFEAPEDTTSSLRYFVDRELQPTDKVTKPIKIGGRYYGYIPYLQLFTLPDYIDPSNKNFFDVTVELLISPLGRLASYKVNLNIKGKTVRVINMNTNLPDEADKIFTPATLNGEGIACRIMIKAYITDNNHLDFD